jgi:hypothetical protein
MDNIRHNTNINDEKNEKIDTTFVISEEHVKLFARYAKMPIMVCSVDTIDYYIGLLDRYFEGCKTRWDQFKKEVGTINIISEIKRVSENIINIITGHTDYNFLKANKPVLNTGQVIDKKLYSVQNNGKKYVSFDITKGNFSVLRLHCPAIFGGSHVQWYDFISKFTDSEFVRNSKMVREIIFGKAGFAKLANTLQEHEINNLYLYIATKHIKGINLYSKAGDEIIYEIGGDVTEDYLKTLVSEYANGHIFTIKVFSLHCIENTPYFYKLYQDGSIELRTVPKKYVTQVIKKLEGGEINKLDLTGVDEDGNMYVYVKSIFD